MSTTLKLSAVIEEFVDWETRRRRGEKTIKADRRILTAFLNAVGDKQMASLKQSHVEDWFYGEGGLMDDHPAHNGVRTNPPISPSTHNQYLSRIRVFTRWCQKKGYLPRDPTVDMLPMKVPDKKRQRPAPHTLLEFLEVTDDPRDRAYLATAINTALRQSELLAIRVRDVQLDSSKPFLSVTITKTGGIDDQPVGVDLDRELRRWLTEYSKILGREFTGDEYLFPTRGGNLFGPWVTLPDGTRAPTRTPVTYDPDTPMSRAQDIVKDAMQKLGLPTRYEGTHTIRRAVSVSFLQYLMKEGAQDVDAMGQVQNLLHHKNLSTTERYLGQNLNRIARDRSIHGKRFLTSMVENDNVIRIVRENGDQTKE